MDDCTAHGPRVREGREAERRPIGLAVRAREALNLLHRRLGRRAKLQREVGLAIPGLVTGASALNRRWGDTLARFDLPQLLLLKSTCELARAAGVGVLSGGVCERARHEISFARARWVG